ncbi:MAG: alpha-galactosidase [Atopobiaceae bacterium]|nr:alpha-galactosidase [Atopobiaceae bacterium]
MLSVPTSWSIRYTPAAGGTERRITIDRDGLARPIDAVKELGLTVHGSGDYDFMAKRAVIEPIVDVTVSSISVTLLDLDVVGADALFLNGYNSWTDSVERSPLARTRGLRGVPTAVINQWVLDNSGDYRFVAQSGMPGGQHGVGYGYLRYGDCVVLMGSLDEDSGYTVVRESARGNAMKLEKEPPARTIRAGEKREIVSFAVCEGTLTTAFGRYAKLAGISCRPAPALVGYSSWYRHYGNISANALLHDLEATAALYDGRELGSCRAVFQIDDGYAKVGDWLDPDPVRFPDGMAGFPAACAEHGLIPGIWLAPFLVEKESAVATEHPDWLLRNASGELVAAGGNWSGAWALDTLNPAVRDHIAHFMGTVTREWGYKLLKLDFLFGACLEPHGGMNRGELMADALDLLRDSVAEGTWFDLCGVPLMSAFGRTEFCRIGCDVGLDWDDVPYMRLLHRERVSTKRSLANTIGRSHLDGVVFRNDPDVFFLRSDVKLTDAQRSRLLHADATLGGIFFTSDDASLWDDSQRVAFDDALDAFVRRNG